jgi:hypothetical protein
MRNIQFPIIHSDIIPATGAFDRVSCGHFITLRKSRAANKCCAEQTNREFDLHKINLDMQIIEKAIIRMFFSFAFQRQDLFIENAHSGKINLI